MRNPFRCRHPGEYLVVYSPEQEVGNDDSYIHLDLNLQCCKCMEILTLHYAKSKVRTKGSETVHGANR